MVVNSRIFGTMYFSFRKEELVGKEEVGDGVQIEALEIHRLNH
jgi:hypothetical protein